MLDAPTAMIGMLRNPRSQSADRAMMTGILQNVKIVEAIVARNHRSIISVAVKFETERYFSSLETVVIASCGLVELVIHDGRNFMTDLSERTIIIPK